VKPGVFASIWRSSTLPRPRYNKTRQALDDVVFVVVVLAVVVVVACRDLQRTHSSQCAAYLAQDLTANQERVLLQLRTGCSLLAVDRIEEQNALEPDSRCDACKLRKQALQDGVVENVEHALLVCCKRPHAHVRKDWEQKMAQALTAAQVTAKARDKQDGHGKRLQWRELSRTNKTRLALGVTPPAE